MTEFQRCKVMFLIDRLFEPETRNHNRQIDLLIDENDALLGQRTQGFNYLGQNFGRGGSIITKGAILAPSLMPRMNRLSHFKKAVDFDKKLITQVIFKLVQPCESIQDIRNALPECLVSFDSYMTTLPRTAEPGWTIQNNPRDLRQYLKVLPKIETYSAMRFLY